MRLTQTGSGRPIVAPVLFFSLLQYAMANGDTFIIDDRSQRGYGATSGGEWRLVTDEVMGGMSAGQLFPAVVDNQSCLRMQGDVKLDNNGGFIQAALNLSKDTLREVPKYTGLSLMVRGNGEQYNIHLRTSQNSLPWQSYRATFTTRSGWQELSIPFTDFTPYRTGEALDTSQLTRIGIVAIGREFSADLCIGKLALYK